MKPGFQNQLDAKEIGQTDGRSVWKLDTALIYVADANTTIKVPAGFETDFASVPRVPIVFYLWGDRAHREAVIHDFMYRRDSKTVQGKPFTKEDADSYFRAAMISRNQPAWIYDPMYLAVKWFGDSSFQRMSVGDSFPLEEME